MRAVFIDTETTAKPLHDPHNPAAKLCYIGVESNDSYTDYAIEYDGLPFGVQLDTVTRSIAKGSILVGANPKFDLHWLHRYGVVLPSQCLIWDVLLAQFILDNQLTPYLSLNAVAERWGLPGKLDVVKTEYWDKGIDTPDIPLEVLRPYLKQDVQVTKQIFFKQYEEVKKRGILPLMSVHMQDLLVLTEMEWNGNLYDVLGSEREAVLKEADIQATKDSLNSYVTVQPRCWSPDFISTLLYGGVYKEVVKEPYVFTYKDGSTKEKLHNVVHEHTLPRLVEPPKQARAKEGFWPTDEATLKKLKTSGIAKKIVGHLLELRTLEKLVGTYLRGFPSKIVEAGWEGNLIHTNYNQAKAVTGRLSSDKPNVQNNPPEQKEFFVSRFI